METHQLCLPSEFAPLRAVREMLLPHSPPRPVSGLTRVAERAVKPKAQGQWTLLSRHKGAPSFGAALPCVLHRRSETGAVRSEHVPCARGGPRLAGARFAETVS